MRLNENSIPRIEEKHLGVQIKSHNNWSGSLACMTTFGCYACLTTASHRLHEVLKECLGDLVPFPHQGLPRNNIPLLPWPALSPDMAPIEHAWDELQRRIDSGPPLHTVADLRRALVREWNQIPQAFFRNLVESMRRRCLACIASNGGHTRY